MVHAMQQLTRQPYEKQAEDDKVRAADAKAAYESSGAAPAKAKKPASKSKAKAKV